ncbi:hypothetical protein F5051DRAFT_402582 [Lentinula edodes]|nr:hypothetical protein F5051DRAFT_402582 [Lentinula edodes]
MTTTTIQILLCNTLCLTTEVLVAGSNLRSWAAKRNCTGYNRISNETLRFIHSSNSRGNEIGVFDIPSTFDLQIM